MDVSAEDYRIEEAGVWVHLAGQPLVDLGPDDGGYKEVTLVFDIASDVEDDDEPVVSVSPSSVQYLHAEHHVASIIDWTDTRISDGRLYLALNCTFSNAVLSRVAVTAAMKKPEN